VLLALVLCSNLNLEWVTTSLFCGTGCLTFNIDLLRRCLYGSCPFSGPGLLMSFEVYTNVFGQLPRRGSNFEGGYCIEMSLREGNLSLAGPPFSFFWLIELSGVNIPLNGERLHLICSSNIIDVGWIGCLA